MAPQDYAWQGKPITRGFTGYEQLDPVGLVHMNGRVYDAELGRFLSPDIVIQEASNLQALNAYTYVLNNPLSLTDPTGYFFSGLFRAIGNAFKAAFRAIGSAFKAVLKSAIGRAVIQIAVCAIDPIASCAAVAAGLTAAAGGSVVDALKAAAFAFVQTSVWPQVRVVLEGANVLVRSLVHGTVGGALSVAQGGSFLQGFASAAIGQVTGTASELAFGPPGTGGELGFAGRTAAAALGGCLAAEITGGKFANGAVTAAFARMFNDEGGASSLRRYLEGSWDALPRVPNDVAKMAGDFVKDPAEFLRRSEPALVGIGMAVPLPVGGTYGSVASADPYTGQ